MKCSGSLIQCRAPHVPPWQCCASLAGPVFSLGHRPSPRSQTVAYSHTAACSPTPQSPRRHEAQCMARKLKWIGQWLLTNAPPTPICPAPLLSAVNPCIADCRTFTNAFFASVFAIMFYLKKFDALGTTQSILTLHSVIMSLVLLVCDQNVANVVSSATTWHM